MTEDETIGGAVTRKPLHLRRLEFEGFARSDGLFEIEARLTDTKSQDFQPPAAARVVPAGAAIHDHLLRLVFDGEMVVRQVHAQIRAYPYRECPAGADILQSLVGLRIGAGWGAEVRKRLPTGDTCIHLRDMALALATAALQSMHSVPGNSSAYLEATDAAGRPRKIDSCYAYGVGRELVLQRWPAFHRPST